MPLGRRHFDPNYNCEKIRFDLSHGGITRPKPLSENIQTRYTVSVLQRRILWNGSSSWLSRPSWAPTRAQSRDSAFHCSSAQLALGIVDEKLRIQASLCVWGGGWVTCPWFAGMWCLWL